MPPRPPYPGVMSAVDDLGRESRSGGAGTDADGGGTGDVAASGAVASSASVASSRPRSSAGTASPAASSGSGLVFDDPLSRPSADDSDRGWGDSGSGSASASAEDDFTRFLNEKPPHHL